MRDALACADAHAKRLGISASALERAGTVVRRCRAGINQGIDQQRLVHEIARLIDQLEAGK
jgi:hypothetical protein